MSISEKMPWGTEVEMMPGKRQMFHNAKDNYDGIYLGHTKSGMSIVVIRRGNKTSQKWHRNFWRQKI